MCISSSAYSGDRIPEGTKKLRIHTGENPLSAVIVESLLLRVLTFMYTVGFTQEHIGRTF